MRTLLNVLAILISIRVVAQPTPRSRVLRPTQLEAVEMALKQANEQLGTVRKTFERDVAVLKHLRDADASLTDPMQPSNAVQKAYEQVGEAKRLLPEFVVHQGIIKVERELEDAKRSPMSADFGRLRSGLQSNAISPALRVVTRNALRLQEETLLWIRVQELISIHLKGLSEIAGDSLRAAQ